MIRLEREPDEDDITEPAPDGPFVPDTEDDDSIWWDERVTKWAA